MFVVCIIEQSSIPLKVKIKISSGASRKKNIQTNWPFGYWIGSIQLTFYKSKVGIILAVVMVVGNIAKVLGLWFECRQWSHGNSLG